MRWRDYHILFCFLILIGSLPAIGQNDCEECVYYQVEHLSRIEGHPSFGSWDLIKTHCVPVDKGRHFKVSADGVTASRFEITQVVQSNCSYERINPMVEFLDQNNMPIPSPTPEEHGVIMVVSMSPTTIFFEYTHPTQLPQADSVKRMIRIGIKDYSEVNQDYMLTCWLELEIYRPPVLMVHGLWSEGSSFNTMLDALKEGLYPEALLKSADYHVTSGSFFSVNTGVVPNGIDDLINQSREGSYAVGKVILIGHSMGGLLSRQYLNSVYRNDVYRLITCNTPHSGSQVANFLLDVVWNPGNQDIRLILSALQFNPLLGAVEDLQVGSTALGNINSGTHPGAVGVHALATTDIVPTQGNLYNHVMNWDEFTSTLLYLVTNCGSDVVDSLFSPDQHDLIVALQSQLGGLSGNQISMVNEQWHAGSTGNPGVIYVVRTLLNEPLGSDMFTNTGYSPGTVTYNPNIACDPYDLAPPMPLLRSSASFSFGYPAPGDSTWTAGDTAAITVLATGADTIVLALRTGAESLSVQYAAGPETTFFVPIPETLDSPAVIVAFGFSAAHELYSGLVQDTLQIAPAYSLTGISVSPTTICLGVGDTAQFSIIGHYDDGIDRLLNGNPLLNFEFLNSSANPTAEDDIVLLTPEHDTLIVHAGAYSSDTVWINYLSNPGGFSVWLGGTGLWTDGNNWDTGCPPGRESTVFIQSGACTIPPFAEVEVRTVLVDHAGLINHGSLSILNSMDPALKIDQGSVENFGTIEVTNTANTALWLNGTSSDSAFLINHGQIHLQQCTSTYGAYLSQRSVFLNDTSGTFEIQNCGTSDAMSLSSGISGFTLDNRGLLVVDGGPITGGRIRNSGTLQIVHAIPDLYGGLSCYYLHNTVSGSVTLANTSFTALNMPFTTDSVVNEGLILIDSTNHAGMRVATTLNSGYLEIRRVAQEAVDLEGNNFRFVNLPGGTVSLAHAMTGIYTRNTGCQFNNQGNIEIDSVNTGILVRFNSLFDNAPGGTITLSQCTSRGVDLADNTSTRLENQGQIDISGTGENGIYLSSNASMTNFSSGSLRLNNIAASGLAFGSGTSTVFTNQGRLDFELPIGEYAINHTRRFTNDTCAILFTEKPIRCAALNFNNHGFLHLHNADPHVFSGGIKVTNTGWIEDLQGFINPATQLTNTGVLSQPAQSNGCSGMPINNFFALGSLARFEISDAYTDRTLSVVAGALDTMLNTCTATQAGVLSPDWYFEVMDLQGACTDTLQVDITPICPVNCSDDPVYWTGCIDSTWNEPNNWNLGQVPAPGDTVTITGRPAGAVFPEIITPVTIGQLRLLPQAMMTVGTGGVLQVQD